MLADCDSTIAQTRSGCSANVASKRIRAAGLALKDDLAIVDNFLVTAATVDGLTVTNVELAAWERIRQASEGNND